MKARLFGAALILAVSWTLAWAQLAPPAAPDEIRAADRVRETFQRIELDHLSGRAEARSYSISESDLNTFLRDELRLRPQPAVERLSVKLLDGNLFTTSIRVDLDQVTLSDGSATTGLMMALLGGRHDLDVKGLLRTADGSGTYEVQAARLDGVLIPATVVRAILRSVGARLDPPFDPAAPFDLQHGIRSVQIREGAVSIQAGGG